MLLDIIFMHTPLCVTDLSFVENLHVMLRNVHILTREMQCEETTKDSSLFIKQGSKTEIGAITLILILSLYKNI